MCRNVLHSRRLPRTPLAVAALPTRHCPLWLSCTSFPAAAPFPLRLSCTSLPAAQGKDQDDGGGLISMLQQSDEDEEGGSGGLPPGMLERLRLLMAMRGAGPPRPPVQRPPLLPSFDLQGVAELIRSGVCCIALLRALNWSGCMRLGRLQAAACVMPADMHCGSALR